MKRLLVAAAAALAFTGSAQARAFYLQSADVTVAVQNDGSLQVRETIGFYFSGAFTGAYRDIPLREGESIDVISVSEGDERYLSGGCVELGCSSPPSTFGVEQSANRVRIVWHYRTQDELRRFTIGYRFRGLTVAYDDVADVNLQVWGGQWPTSLSHLNASLTLPGRASGPSYRVWGHPARVRGTVTRTPTAALLSANWIPPRQFVELRAVFPRRLLTSTAGAQVRPGKALDRIVAEEERAQAGLERGRRNLDDARDHLARTSVFLLLLALGPAAALLVAVWFLFGREPRTGYDREYEREPPSDLAPAFVPALLRERRSIDTLGAALTATILDLIQRGRFRAAPVKSWTRRSRRARSG